MIIYRLQWIYMIKILFVHARDLLAMLFPCKTISKTWNSLLVSKHFVAYLAYIYYIKNNWTHIYESLNVSTKPRDDEFHRQIENGCWINEGEQIFYDKHLLKKLLIKEDLHCWYFMPLSAYSGSLLSWPKSWLFYTIICM